MMTNAQSNRGTAPLKSVLQHFLSHIQDKETGPNDCYEQEFQDLKKFSETLKYACTEGEKHINKKKNRYKDILPFDVTRVVLSCNDDVGSDYINANYIKGASGSPAYIASQGPLTNTLTDFWRMVVQCQVQVIVMACNPHEAGKHKCENYWVEKEGETKTFGCVEIRLIKANTVCSDFLVRTMIITYLNENAVKETRTVCQFHYLAWPDHGVPPLVAPLLDMVRLVRDTQASETLPVLVHCSAGCGRTGTICAIDFVWGLLRLGKMCEDFNLYNLVKEMRRQRVAMVQTKEQYMLVHQAVGELLKQQLQIIQSHHYENLDVNGQPLGWKEPLEQPLYETIGSKEKENILINIKSEGHAMIDGCEENNTKDNKVRPVVSSVDLSAPSLSSNNGDHVIIDITEEKQDKIKMDFETSEELSKSDFPVKPPPPPNKKRPTILSTKQAKEVENLTEKNRRAAAFKPIDYPDESTDNSLMRRPKIAKLRALFERSTPYIEKKNAKTKISVSRSHSLGPVHKSPFCEIRKPDEQSMSMQEKNIKLEPAIPSGGKLKILKLVPGSTPQVKRSKSLIIHKQSTPLLSLLKLATVHHADHALDSPSYHSHVHTSENLNDKNISNQSKDSSFFASSNDAKWPEHKVRRRSFDSVTHEELPKITWTNVGSTTPQQQTKQKASLSLRHQLHMLSNASHRTVTSLASGWSLGIRERRNSFRQAISKDVYQFGCEGRFVYVSEDAAAGVLVDIHSQPPPQYSHLTVRTQNGDILDPNQRQKHDDNSTSNDSELNHQNSTKQHANISHAESERCTQNDDSVRMSSQSMRLPSGNKLLYRPKPELVTNEMQRRALDKSKRESRRSTETEFNLREPRLIQRNQSVKMTRRDLSGQEMYRPNQELNRDTLYTEYATTNVMRRLDQIHLTNHTRTSGDSIVHQGQVNIKDAQDVLAKNISVKNDEIDKYKSYHPRTIVTKPHKAAMKMSVVNANDVESGGTYKQRPSKCSSASSQSSDNISDSASSFMPPPLHKTFSLGSKNLVNLNENTLEHDSRRHRDVQRAYVRTGDRSNRIDKRFEQNAYLREEQINLKRANTFDSPKTKMDHIHFKEINSKLQARQIAGKSRTDASFEKRFISVAGGFGRRVAADSSIQGRDRPKSTYYGTNSPSAEREGSCSVSESSSSSGVRELDCVLRSPAELSWAALTRSKSSSDALSKFASLPCGPQAPPRVRRKSTTTTATSGVSEYAPTAHVSARISSDHDWRQYPLENKNYGVDVDAVAASLQKTSVVSQSALTLTAHSYSANIHSPSEQTRADPTQISATPRKQHYL